MAMVNTMQQIKLGALLSILVAVHGFQLGFFSSSSFSRGLSVNPYLLRRSRTAISTPPKPLVRTPLQPLHVHFIPVDYREEEYTGEFDDGVEDESNPVAAGGGKVGEVVENFNGQPVRVKKITLDQMKPGISWTSRRKNKVQQDPFNTDPGVADVPTRNFVPQESKFTKQYVALADVEGEQMLDNRSEAWLHHMMWIRRAILDPRRTVHIPWEYTRLNDDYLYPKGQVLGIQAYDAESAKNYLKSEPLSINSGIGGWHLFEAELYDHENTTWHLSDPLVFVGLTAENDGLDEATKAHWAGNLSASKDYHTAVHKGIRVTQYYDLKKVDGGKTLGVMIVFNSKTLLKANGYVAEDPLMKSGLIKRHIMQPINVQDVSGRHHLRARLFGDKKNLDQIHFMDPEDLLKLKIPELPGLEDTISKNMEVLAYLKSREISNAYEPYTVEHVYNSWMEGKAIVYNAESKKGRVRLYDTMEEMERRRVLNVEDPTDAPKVIEEAPTERWMQFG